MKKFNYEEKIWGANEVRQNPFFLGALRLKYCLRSLEKIKGTVLEVGCGAGTMAKAIKYYRPDLDIHGYDISNTAIKEAKKNPCGVHFSLGDAYHLPFKDNSLEAIVFFDVLEHLEEPQKVLREAGRVLKKGGIFHTFTPCEGGFFTYVHWFDKLGWRDKEKYSGHIQRLTASKLELMLKQLGFRQVDKKWSGHLFYQLCDTAYFIFLGLRGRNINYSLESLVAESKPTLKMKLLSVLLKIIAVAYYIESVILSRVPGIGVHLSAIKN